MKKTIIQFCVLFLFCLQLSFAQTKVITGTVTSATDQAPLPGVSVVLKGTTIGCATDYEGKYHLTVPTENGTLRFSFIGMIDEEVEIGNKTVVNVQLKDEAFDVGEVVITALGISREKKSLSYAVQEIKGNDVSEVKETNLVNSLSGKAAGVHIRQANTMGGSANIVLRGTNSLTGDNQALFVVDGVPIDNSNTNSIYQVNGHGGYDYGNAAMDINPDDIQSISILKGAAASALYGSRASNGVVLITTKSGKKDQGIGVSVNSAWTWSSINKETLAEYQKDYGAGYANYWTWHDFNNDGKPERVVNTCDDASWGPKFDPNLEVVHWDALDPNNGLTYGERRPWVAPNSGMEDFFETGLKRSTNISIQGGKKDFTYRMSFTNDDETGILPNSSIKKHIFSFKSTYNATEKLTFEASASYNRTQGKGRYGTGYDEQNVMQNFGQWFQTNLDFGRLKAAYKNKYGEHLTWNANEPTDLSPAYANNPYWTRYENYETDERNRVFGYFKVNYELFEDLTATFKTSLDSYNENQDERIAVGSKQLSAFSTYQRTYHEVNTDLLLNYKKKLNHFNILATLGSNYRNNYIKSIFAETQGGLVIPGLYSVQNSKVAKSPSEKLYERTMLSGFGSASVGFMNTLYLEGSFRIDQTSTLPDDDDTYFYPAVSGSVILSELPFVKDINWLSFAKVRANYAEVGNDTSPYRLASTYYQYDNWDKYALFSVDGTLNNSKLKSERTESIEFGLEASFVESRFGFDVAVYKTNTFDQIMPVEVSRASGYTYKYVNSGEIENKGIELTLNLTPIKTKNFKWDLNANWTKNENKVISLYDDVNKILITSAWDAAIEAAVGESYGVIKGSDYIYKNGKKVVDENGYYKRTADTDHVIGNINPDWLAGVTNKFSYKNLSARFLIDMQKGGDIYSVNNKYGLATGLYVETAGLNDKGIEKRLPVSEGGGVLLPNTVYEDGTPNTTYAPCTEYGQVFDYEHHNPTARYLYDASYVKLREVAVSYNVPSKWLEKTFIRNASVSFIGRNLAILHKNTPHFDPETGLSSGNGQGIENGSYPTTRSYGFNVMFNF